MEIRCPHCEKIFSLDDTASADIARQIRDHAMSEEIDKRVDEIERYLKRTHEAEVDKAVSDACRDLERERDKLSDMLTSLKAMKDTESELAVTKAVQKVEKEHGKIVAKYEDDLRAKQIELDYYKDLKSKMSTKMVGESLEQHCKDEFEKLRATAFRYDYFEKDNEVSESGSKGDFIYRSKTPDGMELVSIMFEMKNEVSSTEKKHRNEDFLKELDKDRREKDCEYAVLVSLLEADSELYNQGIVDVSHKYDKMYVIRPQFFIPFITMIRNEALRREDTIRQVAVLQEQNVDILNLRAALDAFKTDVNGSFGRFMSKYQASMDEIDKAIKFLQQTKESMRLALKHLDTTQNKIEKIEVKKLVQNSPSLQEEDAKFKAPKTPEFGHTDMSSVEDLSEVDLEKVKEQARAINDEKLKG